MGKSINSKLLAILLAVVCLLTFSVGVLAYSKANPSAENARGGVNNVSANGQRDGGELIGTPISNADELLSWLKGTEPNGYLTTNISWTKMFSDEKLDLAEGRSLNGNGKKITATTDDNVIMYGESDTTHGYLVDTNNGVIKNLTIETANHAGKTEFSGQSNEIFGGSGFQKDNNGRASIGVVAGVNNGIIDNVTVNVNHAIQNTWYNPGPLKWSYPVLGAVTGANYTRSVTQGIISNTTVNMNQGGGLTIGMWASQNSWPTGADTGRARVAAIAGIGNTTDTNIISFSNNVVNYNGGSIGVVACDHSSGKFNYAATVTNTVQVGNPFEVGADSEAPVVDGLIINGTPNFKDLWSHGERKWAYVMNNSDGSRERNMYITETMGTGVLSNMAHYSKFYNIPTGVNAKYLEDGQIELTKTNVAENGLIFSIHGQEVYSQQLSDLTAGSRVIKFNPSQASAVHTALDLVDGRAENIVKLSYGYENDTVVFDNQEHLAKFINAEGNAITSDIIIDYASEDGSDNKAVGVNRATYTPSDSGDNVLGTEGSTVYLGRTALEATLTITQKEVTVTWAGENVYNATLTVSGLLSGAVNVTASGEIVVATDNDVPYIIGSAGEWTIALQDDKNYVFADGQEDKYNVNVKEIEIDTRIEIGQEDDNKDFASIEGNKLILSKNIDSLTLKAVSDKYGMKITNFTVNGTATTANYSTSALNSEYQASVALSNEVTTIGLAESVNTVNAAATASEGGSVTINVIGAEPSVSGTNLEVTIGAKVEYVATASSENYQFLGWTTADGKYVSLDATYATEVGTEGKALTAVFSANPANVVLVSGAEGFEQQIAKLFIADVSKIGSLKIGEMISVADANLGQTAIAALGAQPYNEFYGWKLVDNADRVYTLKAMYSSSATEVEVIRDGKSTLYKVNADITLTAGDYEINGVAVTVNEVTTIKALDGLIINTTVNVGEEQTAATGVYDKEKNVLQISAMVDKDAVVEIELKDVTTGHSIIGKIQGTRVDFANGKQLVQVIVEVNTNFLESVVGGVDAYIYANGSHIGTITVKEAA